MKTVAPWLLVILLGAGFLGLLIHSARIQGRAEANALMRERAIQSQVNGFRVAMRQSAERERVASERLAGLERDRRQLEAGLASATRRATDARTRVDSLIAVLAASGDTATGRTLRDVVAAIGDAGEACQAVLGNCEERVAVQTSRILDLTAQLAAAQSLTDTLQRAYQDAARQARPNLFRDLWRSKSVTVPALLACSAIAAFR